jgi:hypothetical protein
MTTPYSAEQAAELARAQGAFEVHTKGFYIEYAELAAIINAALSQPAAVEGWKPPHPIQIMSDDEIMAAAKGWRDAPDNLGAVDVMIYGACRAALDEYRSRLLAASQTPPQSEDTRGAEPCQHEFVRDDDAITHHCCQKCGTVKQDASGLLSEKVEPIGYVPQTYKWFYECYGQTVMTPGGEGDSLPVFALPPTAQQALRMAADVCRSRAEEHASRNGPYFTGCMEEAEYLAAAIEALAPSQDTVTMTREEYAANLETVAYECVKLLINKGYCSPEMRKKVVAKHMPKESK